MPLVLIRAKKGFSSSSYIYGWYLWKPQLSTTSPWLILLKAVPTHVFRLRVEGCWLALLKLSLDSLRPLWISSNDLGYPRTIPVRHTLKSDYSEHENSQLEETNVKEKKSAFLRLCFCSRVLLFAKNHFAACTSCHMSFVNSKQSRSLLW